MQRVVTVAGTVRISSSSPFLGKAFTFTRDFELSYFPVLPVYNRLVLGAWQTSDKFCGLVFASRHVPTSGD